MSPTSYQAAPPREAILRDFLTRRNMRNCAAPGANNQWQSKVPSLTASRLRRGPSPIANLRPINSFGISVVDAVYDLALQPLFHVRGRIANPGNAINHVAGKRKAVHLIANRKFQRRIYIALLFVPAHMNVGVVRPSVCEFVNEPGIPVKVENHGLVSGE